MKSITVRTYAGALAVGIAVLFIATYALAQTTNVTTTVSSASGSLTPGGQNQTVANVTLNFSGTGGTYVYSLPFNLAASGNANISQLTNCQVYDQNAVAQGNVLTSLQAGTNTFSLVNGVRVQAGTPLMLTIRCDVASTFPSGGSFQFTSGTGGTSTTTPSVAALSVSTPVGTVVTVIQPGVQDAVLANIVLDASQSNSDISLPSLPFIVTTGNGAFANSLTDCRVRNVGSSTNLNTGANIPVLMSSGSNTILFDSPLTISRGSSVTLAVTCDVAAGAARGGTFQISLAPSSLSAATAPGGQPVTPTGTGGGVVVSIAASQTTPTTPPVVPGVPNTGAGGNALMTVLMLVLSLGAMTLGALYLRKRVV